MNEPLASTIAFLVAPIVAAVACSLGADGLGGGIDAGLMTIAVFSAFFYLFALPIAGMVGLPLFLLVRHYRGISLLTSSVGGAVVGCVAALVLGEGSAPSARFFAFMSGTGTLSGATFWLVRYLCMRPNYSVEPTPGGAAHVRR